MRTKELAFFVLAITLSGCFIQSLYPLYTDKEVVFEKKLIGKWSENGDYILEFKKGEGKTYKMRVFDGKDGRFEAHLVKLKDMMFLDLYPDGETTEGMQGLYKMHLLPVHTFMKVDEIDPNLQLRALDYEKVSEMLKEDPNLLKHEVLEDHLVLTAPTKQLQEFMVKYASVEGVFGDVTNLIRHRPLYAKKDLIFEEKLIGKWKGEGGEGLVSKGTEENTYKMILTDNHGEKVHLGANLVRLKDAIFLCIFSDESALQKKEFSDSHLVPDIFLMVEQIEPELQVRVINYHQLAEILKKAPRSLKKEAAKVGHTIEAIRVEP
ncbi:MAG: hypothetical protein ACYSTG_00840 [Planctomycetota bacterium]|jgi:hypothetical protein